MTQPRKTWEQLMLMMLAPGARIIGIRWSERTATRRVYGTPVGPLRGAADARDAGPGSSEMARKTQPSTANTTENAR